MAPDIGQADGESISPAQAFYISCLANLSGASAAVSAPLCMLPTAPPAPPRRQGPPPVASPEAYAVQFWRTIPLPVPKPDVPPGYGVTGKPAYLVTHGTVSPPEYVDNTPLGRLTIDATGQYRVDWGDSTPAQWSGPYTAEGQPWPDGQITHTYDYTGTYTIQVDEDWTAVWHLAGATGTLTGLRTTAAIPDFRVEQLQAVITN